MNHNLRLVMITVKNYYFFFKYVPSFNILKIYEEALLLCDRLHTLLDIHFYCSKIILYLFYKKKNIRHIFFKLIANITTFKKIKQIFLRLINFISICGKNIFFFVSYFYDKSVIQFYNHFFIRNHYNLKYFRSIFDY